MRVTFEFNEQQAEVFKTFLAEGLASLQQSQKELTTSLITGDRPEVIKNVSDYLNNNILPQIIIVDEVLETFKNTKPKPLIYI